ncbi:leucine-rich repeat domain-containing protein [Flavivirga jejuensis]|uniref:Leucine-rich repeat domain-containing protein n=1 Tax=Flavivirga jejuensis TaxID=870487 RepID=A0ABT8WTW8_9FLAO|nr:leucine-rich repeat domain-containing protein [Flavivirga jejuensis]MDO5976626.1 leucine-rich repeat domain-containing protein [Flavivirga jejuensis]
MKNFFSKKEYLTALMKSYKMVFVFALFFSFYGYAQTTVVNSLEDLLPYLDDDNADVQLAPGTYNITEADISTGTYSNPLLVFSGSDSTYDFTGVTININTLVFQQFGSVDVVELQVLGNDNVLKNLTMVDVGDNRPSKTAKGIIIDGRDNKIEGFHLTTRGSYPYGYGDAFGKGGPYTIKHYKHSSILVRGLRSHVKNCTVISRSYGHILFMQAAVDPLIEGCYLEGEMRSTDDMLAEEGTGSPADNVDFMTVWGYRLPSGFMKSLQEEGIRAYNAGTTYIDGVAYSRGTSNPTILNCTIKNARAGVTLTHASGTKYVEGCSAIGCERGYATGAGDIVNCSADAQYGAVFGVDYATDKNINAEITILPYVGQEVNGNKLVASIKGSGHNLTFKGDISNPDQSLKIIFGDSEDVEDTASNSTIINITDYPVILESNSSWIIGGSQGSVTDYGSNNSVVDSVEDAQSIGESFTDGDYTYTITNVAPFEVEVSGSTLTELVIPSSATDYGTLTTYAVAGIGEGAFNGNGVITSVALPSSVVTIRSNAFKECTSLTSINLENVVTVGASSLRSTAITEVDLSSATSIEGYAFYSTKSLTNATVLVAETLGNGVFRETGLTTINLPSSITSIGNQLFRKTYGLTHFQLNWANPATDVTFTSDTNTLEGIQNTVILYVPIGTKTLYETTAPWSNMPAANIIETASTLSTENIEQELGFRFSPNPTSDIISVKSMELNNANVTVYDLNGRALLRHTLNGTFSEVNISNLASGIYLFKVQVENSEFTKRIVKL